MPQKAIKGQAMVDFLADHPVSGNSKLYDDLLTRSQKLTSSTPPRRTSVATILRRSIEDEPEGNIIAGVGVVIIYPHNYVIPRAFLLTEPVLTMSQNTILF